MSSTEDTSAAELKGGHPPAVKAGGMRIARARQSSTGESKEATAPPAEGEVEQSSTPPKSEKHNQRLLISGAVTSGDQDFTPAAVKQFHEKPVPSKEKHPSSKKPNIIQQPR